MSLVTVVIRIRNLVQGSQFFYNGRRFASECLQSVMLIFRKNCRFEIRSPCQAPKCYCPQKGLGQTRVPRRPNYKVTLNSLDATYQFSGTATGHIFGTNVER